MTCSSSFLESGGMVVCGIAGAGHTFTEGARMRHCTVVLLVITLSATPASGQTPTAGITPQNSKTWVAPRTPDGTPDLQGLWDFRTATPLERPPEFVGREFLSDQDIAVVEQRAAERLLVDGPTDTLLNTPPFWLDFGTRVVSTRRSSLIVEPRDGPLPAMTPAGCAVGPTFRQHVRPCSGLRA